MFAQYDQSSSSRLTDSLSEVPAWHTAARFVCKKACGRHAVPSVPKGDSMKPMFLQYPTLKMKLAILFVVLSLAIIPVSLVSAYANVYINSYTTANLSIPTYGPNSGTIFANVIQSPPQSVEGRNDNIYWTSGQLTAIRNYPFTYAGTVFHVFSGTSGNCEAPFNWNGYLDHATSAYATYVVKTAKCWWELPNYNNEVRIYFYASQMVAGTRYYGEPHYSLASGSSTTGHVSNDLYYVGSSETKATVLNGTWCFTSSSGPYNC